MNFISLTTDRLLLVRVDIYQGKCKLRRPAAIRLYLHLGLRSPRIRFRRPETSRKKDDWRFLTTLFRPPPFFLAKRIGRVWV